MVHQYLHDFSHPIPSMGPAKKLSLVEKNLKKNSKKQAQEAESGLKCLFSLLARVARMTATQPLYPPS